MDKLQVFKNLIEQLDKCYLALCSAIDNDELNLLAAEIDKREKLISVLTKTRLIIINDNQMNELAQDYLSKLADISQKHLNLEDSLIELINREINFTKSQIKEVSVNKSGIKGYNLGCVR